MEAAIWTKNSSTLGKIPFHVKISCLCFYFPWILTQLSGEEGQIELEGLEEKQSGGKLVKKFEYEKMGGHKSVLDSQEQWFLNPRFSRKTFCLCYKPTFSRKF